MKDLEAIIKILKELLPELRDRFSVSKIAVFGSFSKGSQTKDSDIDIYVEFDKVPGLKFMELAEFLENALGKKVDLITPVGLKTIRSRKIKEDIERTLTYV